MLISILIADDHPVVRLGLCAVIRAQPDLKLVGAAGTGADAAVEAERLRPDVLVLDLAFPDMNGLEMLPLLRKRVPRTRVLVLSIYDEPARAREALARGAAGYLVKDAGGAELVEAIRSVALGRRYVSPSLIEGLALLGAPSDPEPVLPHDTLTLREREVLQFAARGFTNAQIAARLFIGVRTVESHRAGMMRKLGLKSHAELIRYAVRHGLVSP